MLCGTCTYRVQRIKYSKVKWRGRGQVYQIMVRCHKIMLSAAIHAPIGPPFFANVCAIKMRACAIPEARLSAVRSILSSNSVLALNEISASTHFSFPWREATCKAVCREARAQVRRNQSCNRPCFSSHDWTVRSGPAQLPRFRWGHVYSDNADLRLTTTHVFCGTMLHAHLPGGICDVDESLSLVEV